MPGVSVSCAVQHAAVPLAGYSVRKTVRIPGRKESNLSGCYRYAY